MADAVPPVNPEVAEKLQLLDPDHFVPPTVAGTDQFNTGETHPTPTWLPGAWLQIPGFEIEGELGRGGMGVVLKARQTGLKRTVAIKMIRSAEYATNEEVERFLMEAESVAALVHPNIVQVYSCGQYGGLPYMVMEYVEGGSLGKRLAAGPLPPREAAQFVEQIARGVHFAHGRRIIHRDLKPDNVLITSDGVAKVADFGLARSLDAHHRTQTGAVLGTPGYMSPEQAMGKKDIGPAADVHALGAILYHLLLGKPPFHEETVHQTLLKVLTEEPISPRRVNPLIARDLETICLKCLEKEPTRRYANAGEVADELHRFLDGVQILARPVGIMGHGWKLLRRWHGLIWPVLVVVLLLVLYLATRPPSLPRSLAALRACPRQPWEPQDVEVVEGKPRPPDWSGFEVIECSRFWDFSQWKPVPRGSTERIEPAYLTTVFRLRKRPQSNNHTLVQHLRTSGLAVFPRCPSHPARIRRYQETVKMPDDRRGKALRQMALYELMVDLSDSGNNGEIIEVVIHSIWWNAFQDQQRGQATDWAAGRFDCAVQKADMTVQLPASKRLVSWGFSDFQSGEKQPYSSELTPGMRVYPSRGYLYWEIAAPRQGRVYRVDWSWRDR